MSTTWKKNDKIFPRILIFRFFSVYSFHFQRAGNGIRLPDFLYLKIHFSVFFLPRTGKGVWTYHPLWQYLNNTGQIKRVAQINLYLAECLEIGNCSRDVKPIEIIQDLLKIRKIVFLFLLFNDHFFPFIDHKLALNCEKILSKIRLTDISHLSIPYRPPWVHRPKP